MQARPFAQRYAELSNEKLADDLLEAVEYFAHLPVEDYRDAFAIPGGSSSTRGSPSISVKPALQPEIELATPINEDLATGSLETDTFTGRRPLGTGAPSRDSCSADQGKAV
jgi:hypothetical protein